MRTKPHERTIPLLTIAIIVIQGTLASPASHREELGVHTTLAGVARQDEVHNLRYYNANPTLLRTSTADGNHVVQLRGVVAPEGAERRFNNGKQQAVREGVVRNVRQAATGLAQSDEDVDYNYGQQILTGGKSSASFQPSLSSRKRAFSVLARWKPFTNISKLRVSNRQQQQQLLRPFIAQQQAQAEAQQMFGSAARDYDVVCAETRALLLRPSGQPLRWG